MILLFPHLAAQWNPVYSKASKSYMRYLSFSKNHLTASRSSSQHASIKAYPPLLKGFQPSSYYSKHSKGLKPITFSNYVVLSKLYITHLRFLFFSFINSSFVKFLFAGCFCFILNMIDDKTSFAHTLVIRIYFNSSGVW